MLRVGALVSVLLSQTAAALLPPSSQAVVDGGFRVQALSPTLIRAEAVGPYGYEDRDTFTAQNRSGFGGVPITKTEKLPSGATRLTTAHYTIEILPNTAVPPPGINSGTGGGAAGSQTITLASADDFIFSGVRTPTPCPHSHSDPPSLKLHSQLSGAARRLTASLRHSIRVPKPSRTTC